MTEVFGNKYKFTVEDLTENKPHNPHDPIGNPQGHKIKDKQNNVIPPMTSEEVAAMWAGGGVMPFGTILQAPIGSNCIVLTLGGTSYKICA